MSRESVEVVRSAIDAWQRGDFETALAHYDEDVTFPNAPPGAGPYRGRDGVVRALERWVGAFSDYRFEAEEYVDAGRQVVLLWRQGGRGKTSGVQVESEGAGVFTIEDGLIVRVTVYGDRREALEAVGLSE
jgi:ketosteroid isomerase-like protein